MDASYSNQAKLSVGAYVRTLGNIEAIDPSTLFRALKTQCLPSESPAEAEIKTVIWLLQDILEFEKASGSPHQSQEGGEQVLEQRLDITIFTDCQMVVQLEARRTKLEAKQFLNRFGKELKLAPLYRKFYELIDQVAPQMVWTKGHTSRTKRTAIDTIFAFVDQAARAELRNVRPT